MTDPLIISGRRFRPEGVEQLKELARPEPRPTQPRLALEICTLLAWRRRNGQPAAVSAKVALAKLEKLGVLPARAAAPPAAPPAPHQLRASGDQLPPLGQVPRRWSGRNWVI